MKTSKVTSQLDLPSPNVLFGIVAFLMFLFSMAYRYGYGLADDGSFFLRYAENMVNGSFWVWNIGEHPIWGASAPFFPVLVSIPMYFGLESLTSIISVSLVLGSLALTIVTMVLMRKFGHIVGLSFILFGVIDSHFMWYAGVSGLETPLTLLLIALAIWALENNKSDFLIGLFAGLLAINKLDLAPFGVLLIGSFWIRKRKLPIESAVWALGIALAWYMFAFFYFGSSLPNSFATKAFFQDQPKVIDWTWFGNFLLFEHGHYWLIAFVGVGLTRIRRELVPLTGFLGGAIICHLIAYSIKYPFEPYTWYPMPSLLCLLVLASIGVGLFYEKVSSIKWKIFRYLFLFLIVIHVARLGFQEIEVTKGIRHYLKFEDDRVNAGKWVKKNTPSQFRVFSYWGNTAYYSNRYVIDGSFLNMRFEKGDVIAKYKPEVLILDPGFRVGYTLVKIVNDAKEIGVDYPFGIHIRDDVLNQVMNVDKTLENCFKENKCVNMKGSVLNYVKNIKLGDEYGTVRQDVEKNIIFIHPGKTKATTFDIDLGKYSPESKDIQYQIKFVISPEISSDAVLRGGGVVGLSVFDGGKLIGVRRIVSNEKPADFTFDGSKNYHIEVDSNGNADTDWLLMEVSSD